MDIVEIFKDALVYPINNAASFAIYILLGIIFGIALAGTIAGIAASAMVNNIIAILASGTLGVIVSLLIGFMISGYELDIIQYGIDRRQDAPSVDLIRQFINGVKLFIVNFVYFLIPVIIASILGIVLQHWASAIISAIIYIIFGVIAFMGQCRLAKSEDLSYALSFSDAYGDISKVGIVNLILFVIVAVVIALVLFTVAGFLAQWNAIIGGIILGIVGIYISFFISRATGLLYSNA
ncbi:MAG: DUF4013 domain-containing protein [Methanobrevibacter sp.]|nr:DUF4013 domain-containing protein [Methanobrevibacter sp.]